LLNVVCTKQGTAYTPVSLPAPKKLANRFAQFEQTSPTSPPAISPLGSGKKLTWSERQALAKKQAAEEEERSRSVSFKAPTGGMSAVLGRAGVAAAVGALGAAAMDADAEAEDAVVSLYHECILFALHRFNSCLHVLRELRRHLLHLHHLRRRRRRQWQPNLSLIMRKNLLLPLRRHLHRRRHHPHQHLPHQLRK
jgi:hypothetical protein